jgi:hypothetical protein
MLLEEADVDELADELELDVTETLELDEVEPSVSPSFTPRPAVHTSASTATASLSAATSVTTSASTRGRMYVEGEAGGDIKARLL